MGRGVKMTDTAKVKKGKVGGDEVGTEDTGRLEADNEQWRRVLLCVCVCVGVVSVCVREGEKREEVLEVDPESREPAGLWVLPADSACPSDPVIPYLISTNFLCPDTFSLFSPCLCYTVCIYVSAIFRLLSLHPMY